MTTNVQDCWSAGAPWVQPNGRTGETGWVDTDTEVSYGDSGD